MITVQLLEAAKIDRSQNWWLQPIWGMVNEYNGFSTSIDKSERAGYLERLLGLVAYWVTSHPPKNTPTNLARWAALRRLAEEIGVEAERLGVRFLTGPTDWKKVGNPTRRVPDNTQPSGFRNESTGKQRSYWLELLDPSHRPGYILSQKFETWLTTGLPTQSFWDYIGTPFYWDHKVKYYGGDVKGQKRRAVFRQDGVLESLHPTNGGNLSTQNLSTVFSGNGWGIFVVDLEGNLYIHKHVEGKYHHSTFLSGGAVQAAGEIVVDDGRVKVVTAKSGHYMPTVKEMDRFITVFPQLPRNTLIRPDMLDEKGGGTPKFYYLKDYRFEKFKARPLKRGQVLAAVPAWAQSVETMAFLNKIPA